MRRATAALGLVFVAAACAPKLTPLTGAPVPAERLPHTGLPAGHHTLVFDWELDDRGLSGRGDGAARIAAPDSARLDFYLGGNFGGAAVLISDSLDAPGGDMVRRFIPPPTLMWAALGRVAVPNLGDTTIKLDGDLLRADIGSPVAWRLTFRHDTLLRAERVSGGRVAEWVERRDASHVKYRNEGARRSLELSITRREEVPGFDASIWRFIR
jgi:hypothetical protein